MGRTNTSDDEGSFEKKQMELKLKLLHKGGLKGDTKIFDTASATKSCGSLHDNPILYKNHFGITLLRPLSPIKFKGTCCDTD